MKMDEKKALRLNIKEKIRALPTAYCQAADSAIFHHVMVLPAYADAKTIFAYMGRQDEINTLPIIEQAWHDGKRICIPLCTGKGIMEAREIKSLSDVQEGAYGIQEPKEDTPCVAPQDIDMALIPCVTCNTKGQRLGYGGGFYDRYLGKGNFLRVILCRALLMEAVIPVEPHDLMMDVVISEAGIMYDKRKQEKKKI